MQALTHAYKQKTKTNTLSLVKFLWELLRISLDAAKKNNLISIKDLDLLHESQLSWPPVGWLFVAHGGFFRGEVLRGICCARGYTFSDIQSCQGYTFYQLWSSQGYHIWQWGGMLSSLVALESRNFIVNILKRNCGKRKRTTTTF